MSEANQIQPYVLAALLCDAVITEEGTKKKSLIGIFDRVFASVFPALHRFSIYVKMTDAFGRYRIRIDYVSISTDRVIDQIEVGGLDVPDRLQVAEAVLAIAAPIPAAGSYEFRIYMNEAYLTRVAFGAEVVAPPEGKPA